MNKKNTFNYDKKSAKNYALINGKIVKTKDEKIFPATVFIKNKIIEDVEENIDPKNISSDYEKINCENLIIAPGLVDLRTQIREPGQEHQDTIKSVSKSASSGGVTSLLCMPNTNPVIDQPALIHSIQRKARDIALTKIYCAGCITRNLEGNEIAELQLMHESGALGFTDVLNCIPNTRVMRRAFKYVKSFDGLIIQHPEEQNLKMDGVMNESDISTRLGLKGIPFYAEPMVIQRDLWLVKETNSRYHVNNVSTEASVKIIRQAKKEGLRVTCDTAPQYFILNELAVENYRTFAKLSPPLKNEKDRLAVIDGLKDGTIDAIVSDHTPQDQDAKRLPFAQAEFGSVGLETLLALTLNLVNESQISLSRALKLLSYNPSKILGIKSGEIKKNIDADLMIFDPKKSWKINPNDFYSKSKNTAFDGLLVEGKNIFTFIRGRIVFSNL